MYALQGRVEEVTLDQEWAQTSQGEVTVIAVALAIHSVLVALKL